MTKKITITKKDKWPCEAVSLLVQRMESHPEEFALNNSSKWNALLSVVKKRVVDGDKDSLIILDDFECEMVWNKFRTVGKHQLHSFVMKKILEGSDDE